LTAEGEGLDFSERFNKNSLEIIKGAKAESMLFDTKPFTRYQFMRQGYYMTASWSKPDDIQFNYIVGLKDSFKTN
jgi:glutaminyl-tRNA synthetase